HEALAVQVIREVLGAVVRLNGAEVSFEDFARLGDVVGERGQSEEKERESPADVSHDRERRSEEAEMAIDWKTNADDALAEATSGIASRASCRRTTSSRS